MRYVFDHNLQTRKLIIQSIAELSVGQINEIPKGFKNNIAWNMNHILVSQQSLIYKLSGLPMQVTNEFAMLYRNGTIPQENLPLQQIKLLEDQLIKFIVQTQNDYESGLFKEYTSYTTSTGYTMNTIEEAFNLNNIHEGIHLGYILAIKKALS